jgi:hypothetical protein
MATTVTLKPNAIDLSGSTSGTTTLQATAVAGTTTITLPAATDTLVGKATTDTLTNKTLTGAVMNGTLGATTPSTVAATTISASSTATFAAGAVGTPSITTTGDTNTGIFFPAADTIAFAEGGAEAMRIDSSGNVGIGTASPAYKLHVVGDANIATAGTTSLYLRNSNVLQTDITGTTGLYLGDAATGVNAIQFEKQAANTSATVLYHEYGYNTQSKSLYMDRTDVIFYNNGSLERMRINTNGYVGIGTSAPVGLLNVYVEGVSSRGQGIFVGDYTSTSGTGSIPAIQTLGTRADSNGSFSGRFGAANRKMDGVGIVTSDDLGTYAFGGQWGTSTSYTAANLLYTASVVGVSEGTFTSASAMPTALSFKTGSSGTLLGVANASFGTERMRITSAGLVGIGTAVPLGKLNVNDGVIYVGASGNVSQENVLLRGYGYYVGATIYGDVSIRSTYENVGNSGTLNFYVSSGPGSNTQEAMRINSSGNLLIGKTSATANGGDLQVSSGITFPATQVAKSDANTLDDYEEGTWTPTITGGTTAGTTTYVSQSGRYTKIGRQVTLQFNVEYSATTGTGSLLIGGVPFNSGILSTGSIITNFYNWTGGTYLSLVFPASSSTINIYGGSDDGAWTVQTITNESAVFTGTITYIV